MKRAYILAALIILLFQTACAELNKGQTGALGGGAGGALIGQAIGQSTESTLIGAALGTMLGYIVGNEMDKHDRTHLNQVYESTPSYRTNTWVNPDSGNRYAVTPEPAYRNDSGLYCREAEIMATIDGQTEKTTSTACREDGRWVLRSR